MSEKKFTPFVPANVTQSEFTLRALLIGLGMCVVLGAANAYLGLRAGMTIAATYPAAVIGMALLRIGKGSLLEENFARTVGSIGESVAAGAIFTIPAFVILQIWHFDREHMFREYLFASALMILGGILGIMFVTILRRVMVEDPTLPFPESVAASEIHKAGQKGADAAMQLFRAMGVGAVVRCMDALGIFRSSNDFQIAVGKLKDGFVRLGLTGDAKKITVGGVSTFSAPAVTPAYLGVGFIIGPELGALNFAGGLLAWGLFVPLLVFFLGPTMIDQYTLDGVQNWPGLVAHLYRFIVRPIAVGGMLVGACYTLYKMRARLAEGLKRSIADVRKAATASAATERTEQDLSFKVVLLGIMAIVCAMVALYFLFTNAIVPAIFAAVVMLITGFFFAAVSGNLVGTIGSSNNPLSGLTLATTIVAALTMVIVGAKGQQGVAAVLAVAAIGCVSAAVAGEMLQDLKAGHILGGTPWKMQIGNLIGVVVAGLVMFGVLHFLNQADIAQGIKEGYDGGFGSPKLSAPQAGLMAMLAKGIVGGQMSWPLIICGMLMGVAFILMQVRSPMLVAVGMYLPLETTFAIFVGGVVKGIVDMVAERRKFNAAQKARVENIGILLAAGFIAGEALTGLAFAPFKIAQINLWRIFDKAPISIGLVVLLLISLILILVPVRNAGKADEPAPPSVSM